MITRMPAALHSSMELETSLRGGSSMPTQPTKVKSVWRKKERKMFPLLDHLLESRKINISLFFKYVKSNVVCHEFYWHQGDTVCLYNNISIVSVISASVFLYLSSATHLIVCKLGGVLQVHLLLPHWCVAGGQSQTAEGVAPGAPLLDD